MGNSASGDTAQAWLADARRIVVKMGSSLLIDTDSGQLRERWLASVVDDVAALRARDVQVTLVVSGAVALGRAALSLGTRSLRLDESQAAAAAGQVQLANALRSAFAMIEVPVAQVLVTYHDTEDRRRHLNARRTLHTLVELGAVPVVNENDTVATDELRYGDNDRLAARVGQMIDAQALVLLSDVDGLYDANPALQPQARHIPIVPIISDAVLAMAGDSVSGVGTGGMRTKILAAQIATAAGCRVVLADGRGQHPLRALHEAARCTLFPARGTPGSARKRWIAGTLQRQGRLTIDEGAQRALINGKSLLSAGVLKVEGEFGRGDAVTVVNSGGEQLAVGLCTYDHDEAKKIAGVRSDAIEAHLGYRGRAAMIHRDDLVMITNTNDKA